MAICPPEREPGGEIVFMMIIFTIDDHDHDDHFYNFYHCHCLDESTDETSDGDNSVKKKTVMKE